MIARELFFQIMLNRSIQNLNMKCKQKIIMIIQMYTCTCSMDKDECLSIVLVMKTGPVKIVCLKLYEAIHRMQHWL